MRIARGALRAVAAACEAAYPEEACGLLSGVAAAGEWRVRAAHPSANLAADPRTTFEVDPALRLRLHRTLRGAGEDVVGVFHSHPDSPAEPSPRDLERAWEPDLAWLILSVVGGRAAAPAAAHRVVGRGARFAAMPLAVDDGGGDRAGGRAPAP